MTTTIEKNFEVNEPIGKVWSYLSDPTKIVTCVPGASLQEQIDERNYKGGVSLKFGPVKAKYAGQITFEELDAAAHKMTLKGKGLDSKGKGSAEMLMKSDLNETDGGTAVNCSMQITIVGKLAQFGSRLINDVSNQLFDQFVNNFKNKLAADTSYEAPKAAVAEETVEEKADVNPQITDAVVEPVETKTETPAETPAESTTKEIPQPAEDNSVNALALMWAVIKGFFARLFGGGK